MAIRSSSAAADSLFLWPVSDLLTADISDDSDAESGANVENTTHSTIKAERRERKRAKLMKRGIELKPCKHIFCGVSLVLESLIVPNFRSTM